MSLYLTLRMVAAMLGSDIRSRVLTPCSGQEAYSFHCVAQLGVMSSATYMIFQL